MIPGVNPVLLSEARVAAAYAIFFASYFVFALGKFPGFKIDRPGAAIIGAVLMMAFRVVGNLTITGSVANIIVVEGARAEGVHVGFREYFRVGAPVAIVTLAIGTAWLWWLG